MIWFYLFVAVVVYSYGAYIAFILFERWMREIFPDTFEMDWVIRITFGVLAALWPLSVPVIFVIEWLSGHWSTDKR